MRTPFILLVLSLSMSSLAAAQQHAFLWTAATGMQDLGTLGGKDSVARRISPNGQYIVGTSDIDNFTAHAYLWTAATGMKDLGVLNQGDLASYAYDVNDAGQVVGSSYDFFGNSKSFIWSQSTGMQEIPSLGGAGGEAWGINASGQVAGWTTDATGHYKAFRWTAQGGTQDLGTLGGNVAWGSDINDRGHVSGYSSITHGPSYVFLWTATTGMQDWQRKGHFCFPFGMNNSDTVVGYCLQNSYHPFYETPNSKAPVELPLNGATGGRADGVNNLNQIVGYLGARAVMWDHGQVTDLGSLGGQAEAEGINDLGQVVGYSFLQ